MESKKPFLTPTVEQREIVIRAVKAGMDDKIIANLLGIKRDELRSAFPTELASSHDTVMTVVDALYQRAIDGNVPAIKFYLECRAGWIAKEKEQEIGTLAAPLIIKYASEVDEDDVAVGGAHPDAIAGMVAEKEAAEDA